MWSLRTIYDHSWEPKYRPGYEKQPRKYMKAAIQYSYYTRHLPSLHKILLSITWTSRGHAYQKPASLVTKTIVLFNGWLVIMLRGKLASETKATMQNMSTTTWCTIGVPPKQNPSVRSAWPYLIKWSERREQPDLLHSDWYWNSLSLADDPLSIKNIWRLHKAMDWFCKGDGFKRRRPLSVKFGLDSFLCLCRRNGLENEIE